MPLWSGWTGPAAGGRDEGEGARGELGVGDGDGVVPGDGAAPADGAGLGDGAGEVEDGTGDGEGASEGVGAGEGDAEGVGDGDGVGVGAAAADSGRNTEITRSTAAVSVAILTWHAARHPSPSGPAL